MAWTNKFPMVFSKRVEKQNPDWTRVPNIDGPQCPGVIGHHQPESIVTSPVRRKWRKSFLANDTNVETIAIVNGWTLRCRHGHYKYIYIYLFLFICIYNYLYIFMCIIYIHTFFYINIYIYIHLLSHLHLDTWIFTSWSHYPSSTIIPLSLRI